MHGEELRSVIGDLGLSQVEAARLLGVETRTIQRWIAGANGVPEPVAQALCAWHRLAERGFAWRPGSEAVATDDLVEIARHRQQVMKIDDIVKCVADRGGFTKHWWVNLRRRRATTGSMVVTFNALADGGFTPASYYRRRGAPDRERDWPMIEEAVAAFACAVTKAGRNWSALR
jgi:transcriptional regulator with XRE-family HTH domain